MVESIFLRITGNSPQTKVLDFMLTARGFNYSKKEIAVNAGISYSKLNGVWSNLMANEVIIKTSRIGKQDMFKLNTGSLFVKDLITFFDSLIEGSINQHI